MDIEKFKEILCMSPGLNGLSRADILKVVEKLEQERDQYKADCESLRAQQKAGSASEIQYRQVREGGETFDPVADLRKAEDRLYKYAQELTKQNSKLKDTIAELNAQLKAAQKNVGFIPMHNGNPDITGRMKAKCIGEFSWKEEAPYYDENGELHDYVATHIVPWDLCKEIYKRMASAAMLDTPIPAQPSVTITATNRTETATGTIPVVAQPSPVVVVPELIVKALRQAVMVVAYRKGDVDTEDGTYATTDTDSIIRLESALCEALGTKYDDIDLEEALELLSQLSPSPRITEQDAREIIEDYEELFAKKEQVDHWLDLGGRALLNKLNDKTESREAQ